VDGYLTTPCPVPKSLGRRKAAQYPPLVPASAFAENQESITQ